MRVYNVRDISGYVSHEPSAKIINFEPFVVLYFSSKLNN